MLLALPPRQTIKNDFFRATLRKRSCRRYVYVRGNQRRWNCFFPAFACGKGCSVTFFISSFRPSCLPFFLLYTSLYLSLVLFALPGCSSCLLLSFFFEPLCRVSLRLIVDEHGISCFMSVSGKCCQRRLVPSPTVMEGASPLASLVGKSVAKAQSLRQLIP